MTALSPVTLSGVAAHQFISDHDGLHDAEIVSISSDKDYGMLEVSLCGLYLCLGEMPHWRETDTKAILIFKGIEELVLTGEFVEYSLFDITFASENKVKIISCVGGVIDTNFNHFEINVTFRKEQNIYS